MNSNLKKWLPLVGIIAVALAGYFLLTTTQLGAQLQSELEPEKLKQRIEAFGVFGPLVFIGIYYGAVLLFISSTVFTILGGLLFGKVWGSVYVIFAATLAAQTAFMIGRRLSGKRVTALKDKKGIGALVKKVEARCEKYGALNIFILRALFLPYIALSYAAGTIKTLKARDFFLGTLISNMIFVPAFVFLGESLLKGPKALIIPGVMICLVLSVPKIIKRFQS